MPRPPATCLQEHRAYLEIIPPLSARGLGGRPASAGIRRVASDHRHRVMVATVDGPLPNTPVRVACSRPAGTCRWRNASSRFHSCSPTPPPHEPLCSGSGTPKTCALPASLARAINQAFRQLDSTAQAGKTAASCPHQRG